MVLRGGILELPGDWVLQSTAGLWLERTFGCVFATPSFQHFFHLIAQRTRKLPCVDYLDCRRSEGQICAWVVFIWLGIHRAD